jgi:hypothetical protein
MGVAKSTACAGKIPNLRLSARQCRWFRWWMRRYGSLANIARTAVDAATPSRIGLTTIQPLGKGTEYAGELDAGLSD